MDAFCRSYWNWASVSGKGDFWISIMCQAWLTLEDWQRKIFKIYFRYLVIIPPWNRAWLFIWTNLNFHRLKMRYAKFVGISPAFLQKKIFKLRCIFAISWLSPLGNKRGPSLEQTWISIILGCFVSGLVGTGIVDLKMVMNMRKAYGQTDGQTDDTQLKMLSWAFVPQVN